MPLKESSYLPSSTLAFVHISSVIFFFVVSYPTVKSIPGLLWISLSLMREMFSVSYFALYLVFIYSLVTLTQKKQFCTHFIISRKVSVAASFEFISHLIRSDFLPLVIRHFQRWTTTNWRLSRIAWMETARANIRVSRTWVRRFSRHQAEEANSTSSN